MNSAWEEKQRLRTQFRSRRRARGPATVLAAGQAIARHVAALVTAGDTVAAFTSTPTEPDTRPMLEALTQAGCEVLLPYGADGENIQWTILQDGALPAGPEALAQADAIVAPALGVDRGGNRLGQGGGWYDRALSHARPSAPVYVVVFADEFVEDPLPVERHDWRVDGVITPEGITTFD